jgi:hypothetical protein
VRFRAPLSGVDIFLMLLVFKPHLMEELPV